MTLALEHEVVGGLGRLRICFEQQAEPTATTGG